MLIGTAPPGQRCSQRPLNSDQAESLSSVQEDEVAYKTAKASPKNKGLIEKRAKKGALAAKAVYLIRDTMKVTGYSELFPKPACALFYVDLNDPFADGTGQTIRVCQQEGVPYVFQDSWQQWFPKFVFAGVVSHGQRQ